MTYEHKLRDEFEPAKEKSGGKIIKARGKAGDAFDYAHEVRQFYAAHPEARDEVVFIECRDHGQWNVIGRSEGRAFFQEKLLPLELFQASLGDDGAAGLIFHESGILQATVPTSVVFLYPRAEKTPQQLRWTFDHELGHYFDNKSFVKHLGGRQQEFFADAYAAIRSVQRYESADSILEDRFFARLLNVFMSCDEDSLNHFTSAVIGNVFSAAKQQPLPTSAQNLMFFPAHLDLKSLGHQDTLKWARKFADSSITWSGIDDMRARPLIQNADVDSIYLFHREAQRIKLQKDSVFLNEAAKWSCIFLKAIIDGKVVLSDRRGKEKTLPNDASWRLLCKEVRERAAKIPARELDTISQSFLSAHVPTACGAAAKAQVLR